MTETKQEPFEKERLEVEKLRQAEDWPEVGSWKDAAQSLAIKYLGLLKLYRALARSNREKDDFISEYEHHGQTLADEVVKLKAYAKEEYKRGRDVDIGIRTVLSNEVAAFKEECENLERELQAREQVIEALGNDRDNLNTIQRDYQRLLDNNIALSTQKEKIEEELLASASLTGKLEARIALAWNNLNPSEGFSNTDEQELAIYRARLSLKKDDSEAREELARRGIL